MQKLDLKINLADSIAATLALVSWAMLFFTLFLAYAVLRMSAPQWPPFGMKNLPALIPLISTVFILVSSLFLEMFRRKFVFLEFKSASNFLWGTLASGILFLVMQVILWERLGLQGIAAGSNAMSSLLYAFTWIHAAHIFLGLLGLFFLCLSLKKFQQVPAETIPVRNKEKLFKHIFFVSKFWHFLGVIWVLMFIMFFII